MESHSFPSASPIPAFALRAGDAVATLVLRIPKGLEAREGWPTDELLEACGARIQRSETPRVVEIGGRRFVEGYLTAPIFFSAKRADRIETPETSDLDIAPHFGQRVSGGSIPLDSRIPFLFSVSTWQKSTSSSQETEADHLRSSSSSISGNQTRRESPEAMISVHLTAPPTPLLSSCFSSNRPHVGEGSRIQSL